jgi:8-amino-7-oxononanoate synthase
MKERNASRLFPEPLQFVDATHVRWQGKRLIYFGGCDYLRMSRHPRVKAAFLRGASQLNVAASRKTTGNHPCFQQLEESLREFFDADAALTTPTGYLGNLVAAQGLRGKISHIMIDEEAHPSLWDAAELSGAKIKPFRHLNAKSLANASRKIQGSASLALLTDGLFAHDGALAPLHEYRRVVPKALLWVDDAHAAGVLGQHGRGSVEARGIGRENLVQTLTLSKAFGVYGGAILGGQSFIEDCVRSSRILAGCTPLPPPLAMAASESLAVVEKGRERMTLETSLQFLKEEFGKELGMGAGPILSLTPRNAEETSRLTTRLLAYGVFPSFIHYPAGPKNGFFRFAISSSHNRAQLRSLGEALRDRGPS